MAKNSSVGQPVDSPAMVEPKKLVHRENEFFAAPAVNGYDVEGFTGDTEIGAAKGNRNSSGFPAQVGKTPAPFTRLRRR